MFLRLEMYPWRPAVVYELNDIRIPPTVKVEAEWLRSKGKSVFTVQFFDNGDSSAWCMS